MEPKNPLLNPLVVGEVLRLLPRKELLVARRVCSLWEEEGSRILRKELTLQFHDLCQVNALATLLEGSRGHGGGEGGEDGGGGGGGRQLPFARLNLRTSFRLGHPVAQEFFGRHGAVFAHVGVGKVGGDCGLNLLGRLLFLQATELQSLSLAILATPLRLSHPADLQPLLLPNLRVLLLRHQLLLERLPFVRDLLAAAPHLRELSTDPTAPSFVANVLIPTLLETPHSWSSLTHIHSPPLTFAGPAQLTRWVGTVNPPLRTLRLHFNHPHSSSSRRGAEGGGSEVAVAEGGLLLACHVRTLLQGLQGTLTSLELNNQGPRGNFALAEALPPGGLPSLRRLSLTNIPVQGRRVFPRLPHLADLSLLVETPFESPGLLLEGSPPAPSVTRLSLRTSPGGVSAATEFWGTDARAIGTVDAACEWWEAHGPSFLAQVAPAFPALRDLRVWGGDDALLHAICAAPFAPQLESVEIHGRVGDAGVTGLSPQTCDRLHVTQDYQLRQHEVPTRFVGDLTRLKRLVLLPPTGTNGDGDTPALTEVCVFFGLTSCPDLVTLDVRPPEVLKLWMEEKSRATQLQLHSTSSMEEEGSLGPSSNQRSPRALLQTVSATLLRPRLLLPLYALLFASLLSLYLS